jgi:hypothetical protein
MSTPRRNLLAAFDAVCISGERETPTPAHLKPAHLKRRLLTEFNAVASTPVPVSAAPPNPKRRRRKLLKVSNCHQ